MLIVGHCRIAPVIIRHMCTIIFTGASVFCGSCGVSAMAVLPIDMTLTDLNRNDKLLIALGTGMQSFAGSQIGTWRQRFGLAYIKDNDVTVSTWLRVFSDDGSLPSYSVDFIPANRIVDALFNQKSSGQELGIDANTSNNFLHYGILFGAGEVQQSFSRNGDDGNEATLSTLAVYVSFEFLNFDFHSLYLHGDFDVENISSMVLSEIEGNLDSLSMEVRWKVLPLLHNTFDGTIEIQYTQTGVNFDSVINNIVTVFPEISDSKILRVGIAIGPTSRLHMMQKKWLPYSAVSWLRVIDGVNSDKLSSDALGYVDTASNSFSLEFGFTSRNGNWLFNTGIGLRSRMLGDFITGYGVARYTF